MLRYSYKNHIAFIYQEFLRFEKPKIAVIILCIMITATTSGAQMMLIEPVFDHIYQSNSNDLLYLLSLFLVVIAIIRAGALYIQQYLYNHISMNMVNILQKSIINQYLYHDNSDKTPVDTAQIIANDSLALLQNFISSMLNFIRNSATIIVMLCVVVYHHWQLAIIALTVMPISAAILIVFGRRLRKKVRVMRADISQMTTICDEIFQALADIMAANLQGKCHDQLTHQWLTINQGNYKIAKVIASGKTILTFLRAIVILILLLLGGYFVSEGQLTISQFAAFFISLGLLYRPIINLFTINSQLQIGMASLDRIRALSDRLHPKHTQSVNTKQIHLNNISMIADNKKILDNISLDLPQTGLVIIRGASGAGKSSLLKLLAGIIEAPETKEIKGELRLNHHNANGLGSGVHRGICYAPQQPCLWDMSLRDNIILNKDENSNALQQAINITQCQHIIDKIGGLNQSIGEDGQLLSGGQRQRVGLARAFYAAINQRYHILLLDEPTSALDSNTSEDFLKHIIGIAHSKLIIIVTHEEHDILQQPHDCPITYITIDKGQIVA